MGAAPGVRYPEVMLDAVAAETPPVGALLREWRLRRRLSQLALAGDADTTTRHLSFIETGRSQPSRAMLLRLAECLQMPLRARNVLLLAGGFAPVFPERTLDHPGLAAARRAIDLVLAGHEPYPALAIDRHWTLVAANRAVMPLLATVDPALLQPPVNVLRLALHPGGLPTRIVNLDEWRGYLLGRVTRQLELAPDATLAALRDEVCGYSSPSPAPHAETAAPDGGGEITVHLRLACKHGVLSFISSTMVFGGPGDVTLSELAVESFFPADAQTGEVLRQIAAAREAVDAPASTSRPTGGYG